MPERRVFQTYCCRNTYCSSCGRKVYKKEVIQIEYMGREMKMLECIGCFLPGAGSVYLPGEKLSH